MNKKILLLVAGEPLAGKDKVGDTLRDRHRFIRISTGDFIRGYVIGNGLGSTDRSNLNKVSTEARRKFGAAWPVPEILQQQYGSKPRLVLVGPRLPAEAEPVIKLGGKIIAVRCPIHIRYERARANVRNRPEDNVSFDEFKAIEERESVNTDPYAHNLSALLKMAHFTIQNDGTEAQLYQRIDEVVRQLS